jgi:hypothetical protein
MKTNYVVDHDVLFYQLEDYLNKHKDYYDVVQVIYPNGIPSPNTSSFNYCTVILKPKGY